MRIVIAEDSVLLRDGLERLLGDHGFEIVGTCDDVDRLLELVRTREPDVAIVDIRLPPTHSDEGLQAAIAIRADHPTVGVLVLSQYLELGLAMKLLEDSADGVGYLLKDRVSDVAEFVGAVRRIGAGGSAIDPTIVSRLSPAGAPMTRSPCSRPASARCSSSWRPAPPTRASPTRW